MVLNTITPSIVTLMLNDIQITSDYMSRWVALKRRVGAEDVSFIERKIIIYCFYHDHRYLYQ
jgi:hypothetical protein